jgi:RNA polymerase sigma-70 factor (ECF subfamily)
VNLNEQLKRAQAGDMDAFEPVIRAFEAKIRAWAVQLCPPGGDADDVAQRTFIEAYQGLSRFTVGTNFEAWLFTIARFQMRSEITRLRRQTDYQQRLVVRRLESVLETRSDAEPDADVRLAHLRRCMEALDDRHRKLLTQRYDTGLPIEDIARNEDRSAVAIRKHLFLLRAKLLECVRSKLAAEAR